MIRTSGFGVDVMPQVYQAAPENLAINPNRMTQGMLEAFEVNDKLNKLRAFQLQQEELNANRAARINAERAKLGFASLSDDANASLVAPRATLEGMQIASGIKNQPDKAALELAGIKLAAMQTGGKLEQQPFLNRAGLTSAMAAPEMAGKEVDLNRLTFGDKIDNFDLYKSLAMGKDAAQIENALASAAQSRATAADIDKRDARLLAERTSREAIANAKLNAIREKSSSLEKDTIQLERLASDLNSQASRTAATPASDPKGGTAQYRVAELFARAYEQDADGKWIPKKNGLLFSKDIKLNPIDEANVKRLAEQQNQAMEYLQKATEFRKELIKSNEALRRSQKALEDENPSQEEPAVTTSGLSEEDAGALKWVSDAANKNHPRYKAILDSLVSRGLIK